MESQCLLAMGTPVHKQRSGWNCGSDRPATRCFWRYCPRARLVATLLSFDIAPTSKLQTGIPEYICSLHGAHKLLWQSPTWFVFACLCLNVRHASCDGWLCMSTFTGHDGVTWFGGSARLFVHHNQHHMHDLFSLEKPKFEFLLEILFYIFRKTMMLLRCAQMRK
jgi:hypothetical protein